MIKHKQYEIVVNKQGERMAKVTIDELAIITNNLVTTVDDLAMSVKNGFDHLDNKIETFHAELKQEIQDVRTELKADIQGVHTELKQDTQSIRSDIRRLEASLDEIKERLTKLEKRSFEDDEVLAKEVVDLRRRVNFLEKEFKKLKTA